MSLGVPLRCNNVHCRTELTRDKNQAVVTTCSHVFCKRCASEAFKISLVCPACDTSLLDNESIMTVLLDHSESYKSMILAGQGPDTIMEISSRALAFWVYQVSQELSFQDIMAKRTIAKANKVEVKATSIIKDWQAKNNLLKEDLISIKRELESEKKKSYNLASQLQDKTRHIKKLQSIHNTNIQNVLVPGSRRDIHEDIINRAQTPNKLYYNQSNFQNEKNEFNSQPRDGNPFRNYQASIKESHPVFNPRNSVISRPPTPLSNVFSKPSPILLNTTTFVPNRDQGYGYNGYQTSSGRYKSWNQQAIQVPDESHVPHFRKNTFERVMRYESPKFRNN